MVFFAGFGNDFGFSCFGFEFLRRPLMDRMVVWLDAVCGGEVTEYWVSKYYGKRLVLCFLNLGTWD